MSALVINSGGLGTYWVGDCTTGELIDCDSLSNFFNSACWGFGCAAKLNVTTPVAPGAPSTVYTNPNQVVPDTTGQTAQDLSNAAILATQAANKAANPPVPVDSCQTLTAGWPITLTCSQMLLAGVGIFAAVLILPRLIR